QNGYAESFHSRLRSELLDAEVFEGVKAAQALAAQWRSDYNHHRPHSRLGYQTPAQFAAACAASTPAAPALQQHTRTEEKANTQLPGPPVRPTTRRVECRDLVCAYK
ncbi:MAG TPA: transposase, partial [Pirellulales bacterium]|nr:transposase [Pirellulales bacterium]